MVRKSNTLRHVVATANVKREKAVERVKQKYEREVVFAVEAATSATKLEIKQVLQYLSQPETILSFTLTLSLYVLQV